MYILSMLLMDGSRMKLDSVTSTFPAITLFLYCGSSLFCAAVQHPSLLLNADFLHMSEKISAPWPKRQDLFSSRMKNPWKNTDLPILHHMLSHVTHALVKGRRNHNRISAIYVHGMKNSKYDAKMNMWFGLNKLALRQSFWIMIMQSG